MKIIGMVIAVLLFGFGAGNQVKGEDMKVSSEWKKLTQTQRRAWNAWAKSNKVLLDDGNVRRVSGRKAMTMVLRNRAAAGEALNPSVVPAAFAWQPGALSLRDAGPFTVNAGFIGFRAEAALPLATKWFVWATPPLDGNAVNPQAQLRFIKCMALPAVVYDEPLKLSYTTVDATRVFIVHSLLAILWSESLTDTAPLREMVASFIDEKVLDAVAAEHAKGRRLLVASTNLDAEEPVIWDLGAIASSSDPDRLKLFRTVLVASASIPAVKSHSPITSNGGASTPGA